MPEKNVGAFKLEKYQMFGELLSLADLKLGRVFISFIKVERYACLNGSSD